jgi:hypothetical protein
VAEHLGIRPCHVRQILHRLGKAAERMKRPESCGRLNRQKEETKCHKPSSSVPVRLQVYIQGASSFGG